MTCSELVKEIGENEEFMELSLDVMAKDREHGHKFKVVDIANEYGRAVLTIEEVVKGDESDCG